jgi:DNA-binding PadR family transcriptional regulator
MSNNQRRRHNLRHSHKHHDHGDRRFARPPNHERDHGHEHGRHHRGGRLARLFEHGDLKMLILHLIAEKPRHGYEIIKAIEDLAGGAYAPSPGVIYPTLTLLEEIGQIASTAEVNRKSYAITEPGKTALVENQSAVTAILERIAATKPREAAMPVMRAMENIKTALRLKLGGDALSPETVRKIADTLDEAARQIEES